MAVGTMNHTGALRNAAAAGLLALTAMALASPGFAQGTVFGQSEVVGSAPDWMLSEPRWVDIGLTGAWNVADRAFTNGPKPKLDLPRGSNEGPLDLCDPQRVGYVAICRAGDWASDPATIPPGATGVPSDIDGKTEAWCSYKVDRITIGSRFEGSVSQGRIFICARVVEAD